MNALDLIYITNDPEFALNAEKAGVDRIMVDLEVIGKQERQGHLDTVMSNNSIEDIVKIRRVLKSSKLQVRINPMHVNSEIEINGVIEAGAEIIMLPMFSTFEQVKEFISIVDGRAKTTLLLETVAALARIDQILCVQGIDEVHIGLNDLHLSMNLSFMFELMCGGLLEYLSNKIRNKGISFGVGGVGKFISDDTVAADLILSEHARIHSTVSILSRSFHDNHSIFSDRFSEDAKKQVAELKRAFIAHQASSCSVLQKNKEKLEMCVHNFIQKKIPEVV